NHPRVAILVLIDEPRTSIYGGVVAAPAFRQIALAALTALEVFPEDESAKEAFLASYRPRTIEKETTAEVSDEETEDGKSPENEAKVTNSGAGHPIESLLSTEAQAMLDGSSSPVQERGHSPESGPALGQMPNFRGLELREVINRSAEVRCD